MALVTLRFLTPIYGGGYTASEKEYVYQTEINLYKDYIYSNTYQNTYTIINKDSYNYRNSPVIFTGFYEDKKIYEVVSKHNIPYSLVTLTGISLYKTTQQIYDYSYPSCPEDKIYGFNLIKFGEHGKIIWNKEKDTKDLRDTFDGFITGSNSVLSETEKIKDKIASNTYSISPNSLVSNISSFRSDNTINYLTYANTVSTANGVCINENYISNLINENINKREKEKENSKMNFKNYFKFGPEYCRSIRLSTYGPAFQSNDGGTYLSYDKTTSTWVDVANLTFDFKNAYFALPVGIDTLNEGDYILHNGQWVRINFIETVDGHTTIRVDNPWTKTVYDVLPERSIFGFNYYTKLVGLMDNAFATASAENPFGNPLLLMAMSEGNGSFKDMLPLLLMQNTDNNAFISNPLMLMMIFGDK